MHIEFMFVPMEGEPLSHCFDLTQLGGQWPLEGDLYVLPSDQDGCQSTILYEVYQVVRVLPQGNKPYHLHVCCREVQDEEEYHPKRPYHVKIEEIITHEEPTIDINKITEKDRRDLWQQFHDTDTGEK